MKRLLTRPMYIKFIEYIGINKIDRGFQFSHNKQQEAIKYFNCYDLVQQVKQEFEIKKTVHEKFNGNYLIARGYDGKQIGKIIMEMKRIVTEKYQTTWELWIYNSERETIYNLLDSVIKDGVIKEF